MATTIDYNNNNNSKNSVPNISFSPPPVDQAAGGIMLTEEERRAELKQLLSSTIPCLMIGVEEAETDITSIFNLDDLTEKRSSCQLLIGLSKILKEYPKGMGYIPRPLPSALSQLPKLREFRAQMDLLIWEIISKLSILKEFVLASNTDLQKLFVVALSIRDAKNCFTQNQCEHYIRAMDEVDPNLNRKLFATAPKPQKPVLSKAPREIMDSTNTMVDHAIQSKSISSSDKVSVFREMISQRAFQMKEDPVAFRNELLEKRRTRLITQSDDGGASGRDGEMGAGVGKHHGGSKRNSIGNGSPLIHSGSYDSPKSPEALHSGARTPVDKLKSHFLTPGKSRSYSDAQMAVEQAIPNPSVERVNRFYKLHHASSPSASSANVPLSMVPPVLNLSSGTLGSSELDVAGEWERYDPSHAAQAGCGHLQEVRGFKTDAGRASLSLLGDLDHFMVKDAHNDDMFFREDFLQRNHINFLGVSKTADKTPVAISICHYLLESGDTELLYIIRTQEGDERLRFTLARTKDCSSKDMIKMLKKARPQYQNFKIKDVRDEALMNHLLDFEAKNTLQCRFKFGVLYCRDGQTEENDLYGNNHDDSSRDYNDFLEVLGERVPLKGWTAYRGGLDVREDLTGTHSVFRKWRNYEIMFHVATMIPPKPDDVQQVDRKRHLGNDIVIIIFKEGDAPISPAIFKSNFNHIFAVVQVDRQQSTHGDTYYHLTVASKDEITSFGPQFPKYYSFSKEELKDFLMAKMINGERWVLNSPVFSHKIVRSRREFLQSYTNDYLDS
ncbi:hypothetical protein SAMD00019534_086690 [Acytostelium subglobosum LB1]|uniref:hypothetical protein n=1 Tax=Acytostelium subglobosum LB1 TaxID=1410327 RepID=UPI000644BA70|nr:hypothetical protein SAMD00019534_086690 [Acytostelium subglobosum LB1]GAM25494.1 hypothetical protein SAMD00019534_086690 [Acytostelium subglobosum LB1]|eukprot:XP_012751480.1 hypothetical protein SAMD00019534_086690 [Acytostelium subglobosum LB1]